MNVLDENIPETQSALLRAKRMRFRQIGEDIGRKGMKDREIIPLLHEAGQATFFTLDGDFYKRQLCHRQYCLIYLDVEEDLAAEYIRRVLRHRSLNTKAKRLGLVIRVSPKGMAIWSHREEQEKQIPWK